jgi:hypothetical protein
MPSLVAGDHVKLVESGTDLIVHALILVGPAASTDAAGNPTPDVAVYDPALYQGYVFKATSYPAAVAGGSMEFLSEETSPGVWAWVWRWGSYRASNSNGDYQRDADGTQECWKESSHSAVGLPTANGNWGYRSVQQSSSLPANFAAAVICQTDIAANSEGFFALPGGASATSFLFNLYSGATFTTGSFTAVLYAAGRWK